MWFSYCKKTPLLIEGLVLKLGKHQRSNQRCEDLGWRVRDRVQSFVLRSYTMHELRNQHVSIG